MSPDAEAGRRVEMDFVEKMHYYGRVCLVRTMWPCLDTRSTMYCIPGVWSVPEKGRCLKAAESEKSLSAVTRISPILELPY